MMKLVLGSSSLARKELLNRLQIPFEVANPDIDETPLPDELPETHVVRLAEEKARAVAKHYPEALIIGSDQVAYLDGVYLGKPGTHEKAVEQLKIMSGQTIYFCCGLCLLNSATDHAQVSIEITKVVFRHLTDEMIENYLTRQKPYHCAGSCKSEGLGISMVSEISSNDPTSMIGMPLIKLVGMLQSEGVNVV